MMGKNDDPYPSLHSMFRQLVWGLDQFHYDWYEVTAEPYPTFRLIEHTPEEWNALLMGLNLDLTEMLFQRLVQGDDESSR